MLLIKKNLFINSFRVNAKPFLISDTLTSPSLSKTNKGTS